MPPPETNEPLSEEAKSEVAKSEVAKSEVAKAEVAKLEVGKTEVEKPAVAKPEEESKIQPEHDDTKPETKPPRNLRSRAAAIKVKAKLDLKRKLEDTIETKSESVHDAAAAAPSSSSPSPAATTPRPVKYRICSQSVLRDVEVAVFASLVSPQRILPNKVYQNDYLSVRIVETKDIRLVKVMHPISKREVMMPLLEIIGKDMNDRFELAYINNAFDNKGVKKATGQKMSIYLLGRYASLTKALISNEYSVLNVISFRTGVGHDTNVRVAYPYCVIVDSMTDDFKYEEVKDADAGSTAAPVVDHFPGIYAATPHTEKTLNIKWVPLVSLSKKWRAPEDPNTLNASLRQFRHAVPMEYMGTSCTVKPDSSN